MNTITEPTANPYVGPRTFYAGAAPSLLRPRARGARPARARPLRAAGALLRPVGRGQELADQHPADPRSLREGYAVLPVGRVGGELPAGVEAVDNVYLFNLMLSLDQSEAIPAASPI